MTAEPEKILQVAAVAGAHGVRGQVKLKLFVSDASLLASLSPLTDKSGSRQYRIKIQGQTKDRVIASIEGVSDRNEAERMKGTALYAPASSLPDEETGSVYAHRLIGLVVMSPSGCRVGEITDVQNFGAGDLLEVEYVDGGRHFYPYTEQFFPQEDLEKGIIWLIPAEEV